MVLETPDMALVHGPPGTGKTTVLIESIRQEIHMGKFVFATAPSNTACDHLLECLVKAGINALRLQQHPGAHANAQPVRTLCCFRKLECHQAQASVPNFPDGRRNYSRLA